VFTLTLRQLRLEALRSSLTVLAIAAVIAEILIIEGFLAGLYLQLRQAVLNRGGDLVVTQAGIGNFIAARSILPQTARLDVEAGLRRRTHRYRRGKAGARPARDHHRPRARG
jgi:hypothetical protein